MPFVFAVFGNLMLYDESPVFQAFNVLRYEVGQKYSAHYDVFDPTEYGPQKSNRVCV